MQRWRFALATTFQTWRSVRAPAEEAISAILSSGRLGGKGWSLSRAEISSGAWLVARTIAGSGASLAGSGGGGGGGGDVVALLGDFGDFVAEALSPRRQTPSASTPPFLRTAQGSKRRLMTHPAARRCCCPSTRGRLRMRRRRFRGAVARAGRALCWRRAVRALAHGVFTQH